MNTANPDKYVRKEIYDRIHNAEISGIMVKCYDTRATVGSDKQYYLISTQLNQPERTKCNRGWLNSTEIQCIVIRKKNEGSRVFLDDMTDKVLTELDDFSLPLASGMKVSLSEVSIDNEVADDSGSEIYYSKIIRLESTIN